MNNKDPDRPPFRADHVGSLLRPKQLFEGRREWHAGKLPYAKLKEIEDDCVREAVVMQENIGLKGITDGDFRRDDWFLDFMFGVEGIDRSGEHQTVPFSGGISFDAPIARVNKRISRPAAGIGLDAFRFLHATTKRTAKLCIPAPAMFYTVITPSSVEPKAYPNHNTFWDDLGEVYRNTVNDYYEAGCRYLQIDDVNSANLADPKWQEYWRGRGLDGEQLLDDFIAVNNAAIAERPADMCVTIHMCRGNYQSQWTGEGSYDMVAERYFSNSIVNGFFLEYDDERSGGFAPLRYMPDDKFVILGLVTSKRPELEPRDELKRRIDEAAQYIPLERLGISPQCGFASTQEGNRLTADEQRRKLEYLVEIAEEVWGGV